MSSRRDHPTKQFERGLDTIEHSFRNLRPKREHARRWRVAGLQAACVTSGVDVYRVWRDRCGVGT
jgi:hypothetical protein